MSEGESIYKLLEEGESLLKDRGSKFYAYAFPVEELSEVEEQLSALKKRYYDARHHCYAYRLGKDGQTTFSTDDGEPSHSAGTPILAAIRSQELTQTLVVVVRYFGGTKLGVRGLIEAYRGSAELALEGLKREEIIPKVTFLLTFPYDRTSAINKLLHPHPVHQVTADYTDICKITYWIKKDDYPLLADSLKQAGWSWKVMEED
ncbi:MAG: YigZ family protein [Bacteroidota bacterium]